MKLFVESVREKSRKDAALAILAKYKEKQLDSYAFGMLSGRMMDDKGIKNIINLIKNNE